MHHAKSMGLLSKTKAAALQMSVSLREQMKSFSLEKRRKYLYLPLFILLLLFLSMKAPYYLVYFPQDESVSIVKSGAIVEEPSCIKELGSTCHVKEKRKIHEGIIMTYGKQHL